MAYVGNVTDLVLKTTDNLSNNYETTITTKKLGVNMMATYQQVDTFSRQLAALTTNTYNDTDLITVVSVNEVLANE